MKAISLAVGVCFIAALAIFGIAYPLAGNSETAYGLAGLPFVGCHTIADLIERREAKTKLLQGKPAAIKSPEGFYVSWPLTVLYGAIVLTIFLEVINFLIGAGISKSGKLAVDLGQVSLFITVPVAMIATYFIGRWIGIRSRSHAVLAAIVVAFLGPGIVHGIDYLMLGDEGFKSLFDQDRTMPFALLQTVIGFIFLVLPACLGSWLGKRQRIYRYLQYLLAIVPAETRTVFIDLALQEANQVRLKSSAPA